MSNFLIKTLGSLAAVCALAGLQGCGSSGDTTLIPPIATSCSAAGIAASTASAYPTVCMLTSTGEIVVELYDDKAPVTVDNFIKYVKADFYRDTIFHRVISNFVVQGGGYDRNGNLKATLYPPIVLESDNGLSNLRGTLAMARSTTPDSALSQFYINVVDNKALDYSSTTAGKNGYAVFGKVIYGMTAVDAMRYVKVDPDARPTQNIVLYWATALK